jgi:hypothetical protein
MRFPSLCGRLVPHMPLEGDRTMSETVDRLDAGTERELRRKYPDLLSHVFFLPAPLVLRDQVGVDGDTEDLIDPEVAEWCEECRPGGWRYRQVSHSPKHCSTIYVLDLIEFGDENAGLEFKLRWG